MKEWKDLVPKETLALCSSYSLAYSRRSKGKGKGIPTRSKVLPLPYSSLAFHDVARQTSFEQISAFPLNACRAVYSFILRIVARPTFRRTGSPLSFPCERLTRWIMIPKRSVLHTHSRSALHEQPGACFSKVPKLFGRISGDIFSLFLLQYMKRPASQNKQVVLLQMAFRARKVLGTFEKRAPVNRSEDTRRILYIYSQAWVNI